MPNVQFIQRRDLDAHRARKAQSHQTPSRASETAPTRVIERRPQIEPPAPSRLSSALGGIALFLVMGAMFTLGWYILLDPMPFGISP